MISRFQYPYFTQSERDTLKKFRGCKFFEYLFILRRWRIYYLSSIKRSLRFFSDRYSHLSFRGRVRLPNDFNFDESKALPRGQSINGAHYSFAYELPFESLPIEIQRQVISCVPLLELYFADSVNILNATVWRNYHIPKYDGDDYAEIYSDVFHQDLVVDQFNAQIFFLMHETTESHGPFEFLDGTSQIKDMNYYRRRNKKEAIAGSNKLVGNRGDFLLFSTGSTIHRATIPEKGLYRDIVSISFFPRYAGLGIPAEQCVVNNSNNAVF
jgi:hypothetical protein